MSHKTAIQKTKVLVVDDQDGVRITLQGILQKKGYAVSVAKDGESALEAARHEEFRVILMDIKMPGMSGVEAFIKIKEIQPNATVIMMTAFALEEEIRRAVREGAYAVIHKPFDMDKVLAVLQGCIDDRGVILVVDDKSEDRRILKEILTTHGYNVSEAESGEECLHKLSERRFHVILLDVRMPGMDGLQTYREVKQLRPDVGIILISGMSVEKELQDAMQEGSLSFIQKPLDVNVLLSAMDQFIKSPRGPSRG